MFYQTFDKETQDLITSKLPDLDYGNLIYEARENKHETAQDFGFKYYKDISEPYEHFEDVEGQGGTRQRSLGVYADRKRVPLFTNELENVFWDNAGQQIVDQTIGTIDSWKELPNSIFSLLKPGTPEHERRSGRPERTLGANTDRWGSGLRTPEYMAIVCNWIGYRRCRDMDIQNVF